MVQWPEVQAKQGERNEAAVCHVAGIFFPYLAPIVFLLLRGRTSKFVRAHALQGLFEAIFLSVFVVLVFVVSLAISLPGILELIRSRGDSFEWSMVWAALIKSLVVWAGLGLVSLWYTIQSIVDAVQALQGRWCPSLLSGRLAARVLGIDRKAIARIKPL